MGLKFTKMCASGNDFIVVDNREKKIRNLPKLAKEICPRHVGVGADGILAIEKSRKNNVKMRIINADGSEAEMCGNGARCAALYCNKALKFKKEFVMETLAGPIHSLILKDTVRIQLPDPKDYRDIAPLEVEDGIFYFYHINTGVPHAIIFQEAIADTDVPKVGEAIRKHSHFQPKGTNVDFVEIVNSKKIKIRTYERGVEDETLACGTGSTAAAIVSSLIGKCKSPVQVVTEGGDILKISFETQTYDVSNVFLEGKADFIYEGELR